MNRATNFKCQLGFSVAMIAAFCIVMTEALRKTQYYEMYKWYLCAALLAPGVILWILGRCLSARADRSGQADSPAPLIPGEESDAEARQPLFLASVSFWGLLLVAFGVIVIFIVPDPTKAGHASSLPDASAKTTAKAEPVLPPVEPGSFPSLKVQGVVYRKSNPSALINGRTLFVGDYVEHARVISIESDRVTVEWNGHQKTFLRPD